MEVRWDDVRMSVKSDRSNVMPVPNMTLFVYCMKKFSICCDPIISIEVFI